MSNRLTPEQLSKIKIALNSFCTSVQELTNVVDETDYQLSDARPKALTDLEDFCYEIVSWVQDEEEEIEQQLAVETT